MYKKIDSELVITQDSERVFIKPTLKHDKSKQFPREATYLIVILYIGYTALQILSITIFTGIIWSRIIVFLGWILAGIIGIEILQVSGFKKEEFFLTYHPPSKKGGLALIATFLVLIPMIITSHWRGWNLYYSLIEAPISGITQELFFRATLLPFCMEKFKGNNRRGILVHSILFSVWHIGVFWTAPIIAGIFVCLVPFFAGLVWGWEAQRDKTIFWTILTHTFILIISSFFMWE